MSGLLVGQVILACWETARVLAAHRQLDHALRFDWAATGARATVEEADVAVVVDVLSFTTTVSVALDAGVVVLPYRWQEDEAGTFASRHDAALAVGRSVAGPGEISLSPHSLRRGALPARLVLPSPNGSATGTRWPSICG